MSKRELRAAQARRVVFVGCQFCGETDKTLRNYFNGKICTDCLMKKHLMDYQRMTSKKVPNSGTKEGKR